MAIGIPEVLLIISVIMVYVPLALVVYAPVVYVLYKLRKISKELEKISKEIVEIKAACGIKK